MIIIALIQDALVTADTSKDQVTFRMAWTANQITTTGHFDTDQDVTVADETVRLHLKQAVADDANAQLGTSLTVADVRLL